MSIDLDQITVNVNDIIPPDNFATVDAGVKTGTVYTKEQDNAWRKEVEAATQSGIKGVAKPGIPYDPVTNPIPTPWTVGNPNLYEKYDVNEAGTFPNFIKINDQPIEVASQELQLNEVQIWVKNGIAEKVLKALPQASQKIRKFEELTFPVTGYIQIIHKDLFYELPQGVIAQNTDIPGTSQIWKNIGGFDEFSKVIKKEVGINNIYSSFTLRAGNAASNGNFNTSVNWINALITDFNISKKQKLTGLGTNSTIISGGVPRVVFYNSLTIHSSSTLISFLNNADIPIDGFLPPSGTLAIVVNLDGGSNVGADLPNSPYQSIFKFYYTEELYNHTFLDVSKVKVTDRIENNQILTLENSINYLNLKTENSIGLGYPQYEKGKNGDTYFDKSSMRFFKKENDKWRFSPTSRIIPFVLPTDFNFPQPWKIYKQDNGKFYFDWKGLFAEKIKSDFDSLTRYYVDPVNGNNSNTGLSESQAVKTIPYAITNLGARNITVKKGIYATGSNLGNYTDNNTTTSPLIIRCLDGQAIFTNGWSGNTFSWIADENVYKTTRTNVESVIDLANVDNNGMPLSLTKKASISECKAEKNSFYTDGTLVFINTINGRVPDANITLLYNGVMVYVAGQNVPYVYFENIDFCSVSASSGLQIRNNTTTQFNASAYVKGCRFFGNTLGNGLAIDNLKNAIVEGCTSAYHLRDAFNYHTSKFADVTYTPIKTIELDCVGYNTGVGSAETSANGSTTHDGSTILRLNSNFNNGRGPVVADVNDGTLSCNLGITSSNTLLTGSGNFFIQGVGAKMWVYHGTGWNDVISGVYTLFASGGAVLYMDKNTYNGSGSSGNIVVI